MLVYTFVERMSEGSDDCIKELLTAEVRHTDPTLVIEIANEWHSM